MRSLHSAEVDPTRPRSGAIVEISEEALDAETAALMAQAA